MFAHVATQTACRASQTAETTFRIRSSIPRRLRRQCSTAATAAARFDRPGLVAVPITFSCGGGDEVTVDALPGQNLWEVAKEAGADITLGCSQGSCGICEVEVHKYSSGSAQPSVGVVRACIAGVPPGYSRLEVRDVPDDDIWGVDGFDT
ncbi:hypothetical protein ACK3TF_004511 [Chlorella vulgaris]